MTIHEQMMLEALREAQKACDEGEIPVGAVYIRLTLLRNLLRFLSMQSSWYSTSSGAFYFSVFHSMVWLFFGYWRSLG